MKAEVRTRLLAIRAAVVNDTAVNTALGVQLDALLAHYAPRCIGFYWPLSGEFDLRARIAAWLVQDTGRRAALPVIHERNAPLEFHRWTLGATMREGLHHIPEPADGEPLIPDLLLIACVGFDARGYRLGYGGGYYDRTLAIWPGGALPVTVGIACEACRVDALPHEAHDRAMDVIVTEARWRGYRHP